MKLLRTKNNLFRLKMIMLTLPLGVIEYLNLYALAHGTPRTSVLRDAIDDWFTYTQEKFSEEDLVNLIIKKAEDQWVVLQAEAKSKARPKELNFDDYLDQLEYELANRKPIINEDLAKTIIRRLYEKNKEGR